MQRSSLFKPLLGAVVIGFLAGACTRILPNSSSKGKATQSSALEPEAQAQTPIRNVDDLRGLSATYANIAQRVTPAVVNINSEQVIPGRVLRDPFSELFGGEGLSREPDQRRQSLGSGVVVDKRGIIVTNNHVVQNASAITVTLSDRRRFKARLLGTDPPSDVAVLKIDAPNLPVVKWADSNRLRVGDIVLAVGSPFNLASTVTQGIISAKGRRDLGVSAYEDFLQTDAAINPGNSGGALVDIDGNLVGINTAILSESGGNQGIGLAIPASLARKLSGELVATGRVTRGWLGVIAEPITDDIAAQLNLPDTQGVLVTNIYARGPAGSLEQLLGGVITKLNGTTIESPGQLRNLAADLTPGAAATVTATVNGRAQDFKITVGNRPARARGV